MPTYPTPMEGEPTFELMARDPFAPALVRLWASARRLDIRNGIRPVSDLDQIERAERTAERMEDWRRDAEESWRDQPQLPLASKDDVDGTLYTPGTPEGDKDGWIAWHGDGKCPVNATTITAVKLRGGEVLGGSVAAPAYMWIWEWRGEQGDIVAYKVVS